MTPAAAPSIAVVGPGAIGTTVAAALHEAGRTPRLFGRTARERLELRVGDTRIMVPGPVHTDPARAHGIPTPLSELVVPLLAAASDGPG